MKLYIKLTVLTAAAISSLSLTSCIDEVEPESSTVTTEQMQASDKSADALIMAQPAYFNRYTDNGWHYPFGYGAQMMIRNMLGGDTGFDVATYASHFSYWGRNSFQGADYVFAGYIWSYYYGFLLAVNQMVGAVDPQNANEKQLGALGTGLAFRALIYLDLARMYEFLPNDIFPDGKNADGHDVTGLTVPIVTPDISESQARNNPRATHQQMSDFIKSDLDAAEAYIVNLTSTNGNVLPDLACVYGLKARLYMWDENYAEAEKYARLAIEVARVQPISEVEGLSLTNGMNTATDFMWAGQQTSEDDVVKTAIVNWTSWASNQTAFGYTGAGSGMYLICDANFFNRISKTDWRRKWFQAPEGDPQRTQTNYLSPDDAGMPTYAALKFRPAKGNVEDYTVAAASAYPVMRVEEMYFIEAEAAAQQEPARGLQLLKDFMTTYRDASYASKAADKDKIIDEIVFQKQVELWGEGQRFFDIKRLNIPVVRGYAGTPFFSQMRLNTTTRPAWTNIVIGRNEVSNNNALQGYNNPDPSDAYTPWVDPTAVEE